MNEVEEFIRNMTYNMLVNLKKEPIDPLVRAKMIKRYIEKEKTSIRKLAKQIGINKSTIEDWLLWDRITEKEYKQLKEIGMNHTEIYKTLRKNKKEPINIEEMTINEKIRKDIEKYERMLENNIIKNEETDKLLTELIEILVKIRKWT